MSTDQKTCDYCGAVIWGNREREADGYRTWWESHSCTLPRKVKIKPHYKYDYTTQKPVRIK